MGILHVERGCTRLGEKLLLLDFQVLGRDGTGTALNARLTALARETWLILRCARSVHGRERLSRESLVV